MQYQHHSYITSLVKLLNSHSTVAKTGHKLAHHHQVLFYLLKIKH